MKTFITIILILSTTALTVLSLIQCDRVDLLEDFKPKKVLENDTRLFEHDLKTTASIQLSSEQFPEHTFSYQLETGLWQGNSPWVDRADGPKAIEKLVLFAHNATVVDQLEVRSKELTKFGFGKDTIRVVLRNSAAQIIADFNIGKPSAWKKKIEGKQELRIPTVYLRRNDLGDRKQLYLCTDFSAGIHSLFQNELKAFRDPRPFALNMQQLQKVRLLRGQTEIVLEHETPTAPWLLKKPLELYTDRNQVLGFLANLSKLEAITLHAPADVNLPETQDDLIQIAVSQFHSNAETLLTVYPAEKGSGSCYATVSDRNVVFELPLVNTPKVSNYISQIPKSINELRSKNLVHLDKAARADLRTLIVRTAKSPDDAVIVSRLPGERYQLISKTNTKKDLDEAVLVTLLAQLTKSPIKDFTSDATVDFEQYGLTQPSILIDLLSFSKKPQQLRIGKVQKKDADGMIFDSFFANLRGTPVVYELDTNFVSRIPTRIWDWQPKQIWNLPVIDISAFSMQRRGQPMVTVNYDYLEDSFNATHGETDVTQRLRPSRAKYYLNENHLLLAHKRLSPYSTTARKALENPIYTTSFTVNEYDDEGMPAEPSLHTLTIARVSKSKSNAFFYAHYSGTPGYFLLTAETVRKLAGLDLFDKE